jgi:primosomal protein N' (replication factor Y)
VPARSHPPVLVEVALPIPLFRNFTYELDASFGREVVPGARLVVPLRGGTEVGICVATGVGAPARGKLKKVISVPDEEPAVSAAVLSLCRWISEYYVVPLGICLRAALPVRLASAKAVEPHRRTKRIVRLRSDIPTLLQRDRAFSRAPQQRAVIELLEPLGGIAPLDQLRALLVFSPGVLKSLVTRGLVTVADEDSHRDPFAERALQPPARHVATAAQQRAIGDVLAAKPGEVFLLHGITGSGKTIVNNEILSRILAVGRTGIVLVPENSLTPQKVDRFRAVFGDEVAVLHSALSAGERYDAWLSLRKGERRIAVGARSAIFAPLDNLGAIIVDEEHEGTYKQGEAPRYHAREVAVVRARECGAVVVLGSATPSLESWQNANMGKYRLISLPDRVGAAVLPYVAAVDMRVRARESAGEMAASNFGMVFSPELEHALVSCLRNGEQCILLLNRRGHSSFLQCRQCSEVVTCPNCSISLTYHSVPSRLICHYCNHAEEPRTACRRCGGETVRQKGIGTQQVERLLTDRFPDARIARMDVDTTSGKWAHARILDKVGSKEIDILLGTQMIAKGLDFPGITLVGVVDADVGIGLPDFRAAERSFQLLSQVAGRAGRGDKAGSVLIQTRSPDHHAVRRALAHDYLAFSREELESRVEPGYPPYTRLANILYSGTAEKETATLAGAASDWIRRLIRAQKMDVEVVGPARSPIERIKARWRWHLLLKSNSSGDMTRVLRYFAEKYVVSERSGLRVSIDRDPVSLL